MNPIMDGVNPQKVADLCANVVLPGMDDKHKAILSDYYSTIPTLIVDHQIDSLRAQWINAETFAAFLEEKASSDSTDFFWSAKYLWSTLQEKLGGNHQPLKWKHIVNAVRHEMTDAIAQIVESASSKLGALKKDSGKALIKAIKRKGERTLTVDEAQYLRSLVNRARKEMAFSSFERG